MRHERRNVSGQVYGLTVLAPIVDGQVEALRTLLDALPQGDASPLASVPGTHFARWVVIDDVIFEGAGQKRHDHLRAARLLFTSNFDGDRDPYVEALRTRMAGPADAIWGHCRGYPGSADRPGFEAWFRAHQLENALFFAGYGTQTVEQVRSHLADRARLTAFALEAQALDAAQLQAAFAEAFPA